MQHVLPRESILKRDRAVVLAGLVGLLVLAWAYIFYLAWDMNTMVSEDVMMAQTEPWDAADFLVTFIMWSVMMIGMMLPSAAPMILLFAGVQRKRMEQLRPYAPTSVFLLGYLAVWFCFAAVASIAQGVLHTAALLSPLMASTSPVLGGILLIAAGLFQWSPLKSACLARCRSPLGFLMTEWREGTKGAFIMGVRHGIFCLGCCWMLMTLLFVLGVMNLLWIAALAAFVLIEKLAPAGQWVGRLTGMLLVGWGAWLILRALG